MQQASLSLVLNCDPEILWTVLGDMVRNPSRYEDKVSLKTLESGDGPLVRRTLERSGHIVVETIEFHIDALMVEITSKDPDLALIHQIVPSGKVTMLNLAATWPAANGDESADLDPSALTTQTIQTRLEALGAKLKRTAEELTK